MFGKIYQKVRYEAVKILRHSNKKTSFIDKFFSVFAFGFHFCLFWGEFMHDIDLTDDLKEGFDFCEVGLLRCHADRSQFVLHALQILVLVYHKESIEPWSLKKDHLAFL